MEVTVGEGESRGRGREERDWVGAWVVMREDAR